VARRSVQDFLFRWLGDTDDLERASKNAQKALGSSDKSARGLDAGLGMAKKAALGLGAAFTASAIVDFGKQAISAASDLEESINAVQVATGGMSDEILAFGDNAAQTLGMSKKEVNEAAVRFAAFVEKIGGGADTMEVLLTRAADFASVMNLDMAEALEKFQSGLAGETEPLRAFGLDLSAAAVEAYALENGLAASKKEMTESVKIQARYGLLLEQTEKTAGDFANTSDSLANQQRILNAEWENAQAIIGEQLLPIVTDLASGFVGAVGEIEGAALGFRKLMIDIRSDIDFLPGISDTPYAQELMAVIDAQQEFNDAIDDGASRSEGLEVALRKLYDAGLLNNLSLQELTSALRITDEEMVAAGRSLQDFAVGKAPKLTAEVRELSSLFRPYVQGLQDADKEQKDTAKSAIDLVRELEGLTEETEEAAEGTEELAEATDEAGKSFRELVDPIGNAEKAIANYDEALQEATEDGVVTKDEAIELAEALANVDEAASTITAENIDAFREAMIRTGEVTEEEAQKIIDNLESVKRIEFTPSLAPFENLIRRMEEASSRPITIDFANLRFASRAEIERQITYVLQRMAARGDFLPL
jgi:hypothetical protein